MATASFSPSFCSLFASCFFEAQRRQTRHLKITDKFQPPGGGSFQVSLPERLIGFSGLGLFSFDFFATSAHDQLLFADARHPMVSHGRIAPPDPSAAISRLRAQFPDVPEIQSSMLSDVDNTTIHGICSIAAVATDALFYYRCPNNAMPGAAIWVLIRHAVATPPATLPANLATLEPPRDDFGSYDLVLTAFDAARPAGQAVRLNEFRINYTSMMTTEFPPGVSMKDLLLGFLTRNGYDLREIPNAETSSEGDPLAQIVVSLSDGSPGLTATFDAIGRLRSLRMTLSGDAYANDDYPL